MSEPKPNFSEWYDVEPFVGTSLDLADIPAEPRNTIQHRAIRRLAEMAYLKGVEHTILDYHQKATLGNG